MNHEALDIESVDSARISKSLRKFEACLAEYKEAKAELVDVIRAEYAKTHEISQYKRGRLRVAEISKATGIAISWISQVLSGKRTPEKPECIIALARYF